MNSHFSPTIELGVSVGLNLKDLTEYTVVIQVWLVFGTSCSTIIGICSLYELSLSVFLRLCDYLHMFRSGSGVSLFECLLRGCSA